MSASGHLLETITLGKCFAVARGLTTRRAHAVRAVESVSIHVDVGETLGIVGESGCGKSTLAKMILGLEPPTFGHVLFRSQDVALMDRQARKDYRRSVQAVFQDPTSSLNPRMKIGQIVAEPLVIRGQNTRTDVRSRVRAGLEEVGIDPTLSGNYPHEFSGGQKQRIAIARALALEPALVILDEPVSALDLSLKAQLLSLLRKLQQERSLSYVFIAHDLAAVRHLSQRVAVMYLGEVVETGAAREMFHTPLHPYTQLLLEGTLVAKAQTRERIQATFGVGVDDSVVDGCRFRNRCKFAFARCAEERPALRPIEPGREAACHLYE